MAMMAAMCVMSAGGITAYANVDEAAVAQAEAEAQQTETVVTEEPVIDRSEAFSQPGNGEVVDEFKESKSKDFYTIRTENNQIFYMVIDHASNTDNVYMLSTVDEADLKEFLPETEAETVTKPPVVLEEETLPSVDNTQVETEVMQPQKTEQNKMLLGIGGIVAAVGLIGGLIWNKKKKDEEDEVESENLEMDDGIQTIDEDEE